jgi:hypothetical protein
MAAVVQFVDSIAANPTVRLDLNTFASGLMVGADGIDFSPPPLRRAVVSTLLADGDRIPAAAYGNRTLKLPVQVVAATATAAANALQDLAFELNRPANILRVQLTGMTSPVFFRAFRAPDYTLAMLRLLAAANTRATLEIPAEPFGYGLKQILPPVMVNNDPAAALNGMFLDVDSTITPSNANPYFNGSAANWTGANGASVAPTSAQFHEGSGAMRITPDGVTASPRAQSEAIPVVAGQSIYAQSWLRSPGGTPTVGTTIRWFSDAAGTVFVSRSGSPSLVLAANTWTFSAVSDVAPATAVSYRLAPEYSGTPTAGTLLDVDEALGGPSQGVLGDVETPLSFSLPAGDLYASDNPLSVIAARRRGVTGTPFFMQAESANVLGADTTFPANDAAMSGTSNNYSRTTFATDASITARLSYVPWPTPHLPTKDQRGTYRVFACVRKTVAADQIKVGLEYLGGSVPVGGVATYVVNDLVTLSTSTTARQIVDLGLVQVPAGTDPIYDGYSGVEIGVLGRDLHLRAGRTSGTGNLDVDYLLFVPADDRLSIVDWGDASATTDEFAVDAVSQMVYTRITSGEIYPAGSAQVAGSVGVMASPGGPTRLYFVRRVGQGVTDTKTATTPITAWYWPRYMVWAP